jgi:hypothetical protein
VRGIAGAQRELARRRRDQFDDVFRIEPHDQVVDSASGRRHQLSCAGVQHPHPAVGEQPQRGAMNLLDRSSETTRTGSNGFVIARQPIGCGVPAGSRSRCVVPRRTGHVELADA